MSDFPYPGLRPFERDENDIFFGREEQTDQLIKRLGDTHLLAVLGQSGCGKSSLVRTGLLAGLETGFLTTAGGSWRIAELRPGNHPFWRLAETFVENQVLPDTIANFTEPAEAVAFIQANLQQGPSSLHEILQETPLPDNTNLLILVDQFEEIFRYYQQGDHNEAAAFVQFLLASSNHPAVYVVVTMRSDFIGDCATFYGLPEAINQGLFLTPRLTRNQLSDAIELPAGIFGGKVEPGLVNLLLNEVGSDAKKLPPLQHALMRMWRLARVKNPTLATLTLTHYKQIGGLENALSQHADEAYAELNSAQQEIGEILFKNLSERSNEHRDTRRPVQLSAVASLANVPWQPVAAVVEIFRQEGRSFLMPPLGKALTPDTILDISHESLIHQWQRMKVWTDREADSAKHYRRLEDTAYRWNKGQAALWRKPDLQDALVWREQEQPNAVWAKRYGKNFDLAMQFLDKSEAQQKYKQRWQMAVGGVFAFVIGLCFHFYAQWQNTLGSNQQILDSQITQAFLLARGEDYAGAKQVLDKNRELYRPIPQRRHVRDLLYWFSQLMSGTQQYIYEGANVPLETIAISPDTNLLAAAGKRTLVLFDLNNGELRQRLQGHNDDIKTLIIEPQSKWLATAGWDSQIIFWSLPNGEKLKKWQAPNAVNALAISPDGTILASGGYDNNITLWDAKSGEILRTFKGHSAPISTDGLVFNPKGDILASASADKTARLWNVATGETLHVLAGHTDTVENVALSKDGKLLATSSDDKTIRLWDVDSGKTLHGLHGHQRKVYGLRFIADGRYLVSSSEDQTLRLWHTDSGVTVRVLRGHTAGVNGITTYAKNVFSTSRDGTVMRWDTALPHWIEKDLQSETRCTAIAPDGIRLAVGFKNGALHLYSLPEIELLWKQETAHDKLIKRLAFSPDGTLLASASFDKTAKLWQVKDGTLEKTFRGHKKGIYSVAFSPNGQTLATASKDSQIGLFSLSSEQKQFHPAHKGPVYSVAFDSSGTQLLTSGADGYTRLWTINENFLLKKEFSKQTNKTLWASFSPDNKQIASVGQDQFVHIYTHDSSQKQRRFGGHDNTIFRVIFSPDNQQIATASADATIRLWDLSTKNLSTKNLSTSRELWTLHLPTKISGSGSPLWDFDFRCTPKGCWIAVPTHHKLLLYDLGPNIYD